MDIVVTVPKREYKTDAAEDELLALGESGAFWAMNRRPLLSPGERVYFVKEGKITTSMKVDRIESGEAQCDLTGRTWPGKCIIHMTDLRTEEPIEVKGFRGFRYRWWKNHTEETQ